MRLLWYRNIASSIGANLSKIFSKEISYFPRIGNVSRKSVPYMNIHGNPHFPLFLLKTSFSTLHVALAFDLSF